MKLSELRASLPSQAEPPAVPLAKVSKEVAPWIGTVTKWVMCAAVAVVDGEKLLTYRAAQSAKGQRKGHARRDKIASLFPGWLEGVRRVDPDLSTLRKSGPTVGGDLNMTDVVGSFQDYIAEPLVAQGFAIPSDRRVRDQLIGLLAEAEIA